MKWKVKWNRIFIPCIAALFCLSAPFLMGQTGDGSVVGTVHDPSGAVVPNAAVTLTGTETGTALTTKSSSAGEYVFPVVPVGTYKLTVSAPGFSQAERSGVVVGLNKTVTVDAALQVGAATATVQVQALSSQLETTTSQAATTIDQTTFDDLPIALTGSARSVTSVADLMPGVADTPALGYGSTGAQGQEFSTSINGGQAWGGEVIYDGIPFISSNQSGDYRVQAVPVEALQEFSLVQNNFSAEYSRTPGGALTYSTRAGTNAFHGQAYEYMRNTDLDAEGYFATGPTITHQNEFGVNVGGPIIIPHVYNGHDKLFFFAFYSGFRFAGGVTPGLVTIPTIAERSGDFSALGVNIYDPRSTTCNSSGVCTRTQYDYNGVPNVMAPSQISSVATQFDAYLPTPINNNLTNNFVEGGVNDTVEDRWGGRVDYSLSENNHIHGFFSTGPINVESYDTVFLPPIADYTSSVGLNKLGLARLELDHTFSPSVLLHLGFGYNYETENSTALYNNDVNTFGIPNALPVTPQFYCNPGVCPYATNGGGSGTNEAENSYIESGFLSWTKGNNQFKFGGEFDKVEGNIHTLDQVVDSLNPLETSYPGNSATGDGWASFTAGAFDAVQQFDVPLGAENRFQALAAYFIDNYKITPSLTLNMGVRYDIPWTNAVANNVASTFDPTLPNPGAGGIPGALLFQGHGQYTCNCNRLADTVFKLFQPRFGFAYKLNDKTVVHGGYGIFISIDGAANGNGFATIADGYNADAVTSSVNNGITPAMYVENGYPSFPKPPFIDPTYDNNSGTQWIPKTSGLPGVISDYTLDIQRQLPDGFLFDIGYVGNTAQHLGSELWNPSQIPIGYVAEYGSALGDLLSSVPGQATGVPSPYPGFTGTVAQALRQFPQYTSITVDKLNTGHSTYNSLQSRLQRQFRNGFSLLVSYTFAKQMTNAEAEIGQFNDGPQDAYNLRGEYSSAFTEPPQTLAISGDYDLPFGYNREFLNHGIAASVIGGWGVSGILHYQGGTSMFETSVNNTLPIGNDDLRPNYVPGQPEKAHWTGKFNPHTDIYINPNAFTAPPPGTFGNTPRNLPLRSFGYYDEALSARKNFHLWESVNLQFRSDWFNAFNRSIFSTISTGASNPQIPTSGFGSIASQGNFPRSIQFALKLVF